MELVFSRVGDDQYGAIRNACTATTQYGHFHYLENSRLGDNCNVNTERKPSQNYTICSTKSSGSSMPSLPIRICILVLPLWTTYFGRTIHKFVLTPSGLSGTIGTRDALPPPSPSRKIYDLVVFEKFGTQSRNRPNSVIFTITYSTWDIDFAND
ncbi:hypothetical protein P170DRAFT_426040 [Aspergillus steynii IBT 23096]|uniref:Uncharacterized protein n=1 Tax=Aspergillus steynii IBT 23096 TaxID=1392250 RepID=A0A2I2G835_9EURO|nr:uncharacterized protein P170DRAFT_426040 [Aspergillus steynii IBT 23096]PLB49052.1 hypothetical protein P170DRAFT_426040 [Aspergillus steynii IBT 23096]